jgi:hypothetical protein
MGHARATRGETRKRATVTNGQLAPARPVKRSSCVAKVPWPRSSKLVIYTTQSRTRLNGSRVTKSVTIVITRDGQRRTLADNAGQLSHVKAVAAHLTRWLWEQEAEERARCVPDWSATSCASRTLTANR